jgi:hypothetical protein
MNNAATQTSLFTLYRQQRGGRNIQALATGTEQDMLNRHEQTPIGDGWFHSVRPIDHETAQQALAATDLDRLIRDKTIDGYRTADGYTIRRMYAGKPYKVNGTWSNDVYPAGHPRAGRTVDAFRVIAPTGETISEYNGLDRDAIRTAINRHRDEGWTYLGAKAQS